MITTDDILGDDVLDPDGDVLGVATTLHIDTETYEVKGLTIDQGFGSPRLYVGVNHIDRFGVDAVFLSKRPLTNLDGQDVYTEEGGWLGTVSNVKRLDDGTTLVVRDGETTRSVPKHAVVQKGDAVIVDYHPNKP